MAPDADNTPSIVHATQLAPNRKLPQQYSRTYVTSLEDIVHPIVTQAGWIYLAFSLTSGITTVSYL